MMLVRPAAPTDQAALLSLVEGAPRKVHDLPRAAEAMRRALDRSRASFDETVTMAGSQSYFMVLEDTGDGSLAGAAMIHASAGATRPYLAFRYALLPQAGADGKTGRPVESLILCRDLSSFSQVGGFAMRDEAHAGAHAALLSRARLMFAAMEQHRFADDFFATLPGTCDDAGESPFWNALGRNYFDMHHIEAQALVDSVRIFSLIEKKMPDFSASVASLPEAARDALGYSAQGGKPVQHLLKEGFEGGQLVDFYDGGMIFQSHKRSLRSFVGSIRCTVAPPADAPGPGEDTVTYLVSALGKSGFRALLADCPPITNSVQVALPGVVTEALGVTVGEQILCVEL